MNKFVLHIGDVFISMVFIHEAENFGPIDRSCFPFPISIKMCADFAGL